MDREEQEPYDLTNFYERRSSNNSVPHNATRIYSPFFDGPSATEIEACLDGTIIGSLERYKKVNLENS